jgi:hypothetical protein
MNEDYFERVARNFIPDLPREKVHELAGLLERIAEQARSRGHSLDATQNPLSLHSAQNISERMVTSADRLFNSRIDLRRDHDVLQDAYDDASGVHTQELYGNPDVKQTKDMIYTLDGVIGTTARQMEHLARVIRGILGGTPRRW